MTLLITVASLLLLRLEAEVTAEVSFPSFTSEEQNITVAVGRDAKLSCTVDELYHFKMAWLHKSPSSRAVLATGTQVVTKNPRVSASREGQAFILNIDNVTQKDQGVYVCQLNTKPTLTQRIVLNVVVPPVIDDGASSGDLEVDEGRDVMLTCEARGNPPPAIRWIREDGGKIVSKGKPADEWRGRQLRIGSAGRAAAGAYLCIASNGFQPSVSKRLLLRVSFAPLIEEGESSPNRVVAVSGATVILSCTYSAYPAAGVTWYADGSDVIENSSATVIIEETLESGRRCSTLTLQGSATPLLGTYRCVVSNRRGMHSATFLLVEPTTTSSTTTPHPSVPSTGHLHWGNRPLPTSVPTAEPLYIPMSRGSDGPSTSLTTASPRGARSKGPAPAPQYDSESFYFGSALSSGRRVCSCVWQLLILLHLASILANKASKWIWSPIWHHSQ